MLSVFHKGAVALCSAASLLLLFALPSPSYAAPIGSEIPPEAIELPTQKLKVSGDYELAIAPRDVPTVTSYAEIQAAEAALEPQVYANVPQGVGAQGLVDAALSQLGVAQDCTNLVQNSLAAIGLTQRLDQGGFDLGTGIWQYDGFGTRVDINSLLPGDILVYGNAGSGAHVAIYIGDGQAVHGGFSGNTVIAAVHYTPGYLTGAIRVH